MHIGVETQALEDPLPEQRKRIENKAQILSKESKTCDSITKIVEWVGRPTSSSSRDSLLGEWATCVSRKHLQAEIKFTNSTKQQKQPTIHNTSSKLALRCLHWVVLGGIREGLAEPKLSVQLSGHHWERPVSSPSTNSRGCTALAKSILQ